MGARTAADFDGLVGELKKALAERMLNAEMDVHLDSEAVRASGNHRNDTSPKSVVTGSERVVLDIPRDRQARFDPARIGKYQRRFPGFDDKILIAVVDGLKGFPQAIAAVYPDTVVQTCIVHLLRYSMQFASWKEHKAIAKALRPVYAAANAAAAEGELAAFEAGRPGARSTPRSRRAGSAAGRR